MALREGWLKHGLQRAVRDFETYEEWAVSCHNPMPACFENKFYFRGKDVDEMTVEELREAVKFLGKLVCTFPVTENEKQPHKQ